MLSRTQTMLTGEEMKTITVILASPFILFLLTMRFIVSALYAATDFVDNILEGK